MATEFEKAIEQRTGLSVEKIRRTPVDQLRRRIENQYRQPMRVTGGGDTLITHQQVQKMVDKAIR